MRGGSEASLCHFLGPLDEEMACHVAQTHSSSNISFESPSSSTKLLIGRSPALPR